MDGKPSEWRVSEGLNGGSLALGGAARPSDSTMAAKGGREARPASGWLYEDGLQCLVDLVEAPSGSKWSGKRSQLDVLLSEAAMCRVPDSALSTTAAKMGGRGGITQ